MGREDPCDNGPLSHGAIDSNKFSSHFFFGERILSVRPSHLPVYHTAICPSTYQFFVVVPLCCRDRVKRLKTRLSFL